MGNNEKKHYDMTRLARARAAEGWGKKHHSKHEAVGAMTPADITEGALLELVRRLNQAIAAWSNDKNLEDEYDRDSRPSNAKKFSEKKVGDLLYSCSELTGPADAQVIIHVDEEGYIRIVGLDTEIKDGKVWASWGCDWHSETAEEAVRREAENDVEYHEPKLKRAKDVLAALDRGEPYEHFLVDLDD